MYYRTNRRKRKPVNGETERRYEIDDRREVVAYTFVVSYVCVDLRELYCGDIGPQCFFVL